MEINPLFWIIFISLIFWSFYKKWDEDTDKYINYPYITTLYFLFASGVLIFLNPVALRYLVFDKLGVIFLSSVIVLTFLLYKVLRLIKKPIRDKNFFDYFELLDVRYIFPKLAEILFQQIFFISVFLLSLSFFGEILTVWVTVLAFVLAHLNLFFFQGKKIGLFYFAFAVIGAPIFILLIIETQVLWYSLALHMLFYTVLSAGDWFWGIIKRH